MKNDEFEFRESIGGLRYLTTGVQRGELLVHVREYKMETEKEVPTKKGVMFTKKLGPVSSIGKMSLRTESARQKRTNPWAFLNISPENITSESIRKSSWSLSVNHFLPPKRYERTSYQERIRA